MQQIVHPKIVIVGRPNVGKSSLFNRIVGSRKAIVEATCGTTRDRLYADIVWKGKDFTIVDTGGYEPSKRGGISTLILKQLETALKGADILFFVTDGSVGITPQDTILAERLRKTSKRLYLIVNKVDDKQCAAKTPEFFSMGLGEPFSISAMNGTGIDRLLDEVARSIERPPSQDTKSSVHVAIVGRPNVGKSSYLNAIFKEERVIVDSIAGTTRDAVDTDFKYKGRDYVLIDTAGMRHNPTIVEAADFYGSVRSKEAIQRSHAAIVMIDGFDGLREDDKRIMDFVIRQGKALVVAVNKWDLTEGVERAKYTDMLTKKMNIIKNYPIVFMSCKTRENIMACLDVIWATYERFKVIVDPIELKEILKSLNSSVEITGKRIKFLYLIQEGTMPPSFILGNKSPKLITDNLKRYIENFFRRSSDYKGVPIKIRYTG